MQKDLKEIVPLFQSLSQPTLILGMERDAIFIWTSICAYIWVAGKDMVCLIVAGSLWVVGVFIGTMLAKKDPLTIKILLKSLRYKNYYSARERLITPNIRKTKIKGKQGL